MHSTQTINGRNSAPVRRANSCAFVILGAAGDLASRKLYPALYHLAENNLLSDEFCVIGMARRDWTHENWRGMVMEDLEHYCGKDIDKSVAKKLLDRFYFQKGDLDKLECYNELSDLLKTVDSKHNTGGNRVYYLATPPHWFAPAAEHLGKAGLSNSGEDGAWTRLVVEKPFGNDLQSAYALNQQIWSAFQENQIFRIDHYLGKETVQNIMVFRFAVGLFEPIWNHNYVDNVQITVAETVGVEERGNYYDNAGALRDMVPNHMFQVLALTAKEPPSRYEAEIVRDAKRDVFRAVRDFSSQDLATNVVRAQYTTGAMDGQHVPAYRSEHAVRSDSMTETYVAMKLFIDNARWKDVPFYLRTGKRLPKRTSEVAIQFKRQMLMRFDSPAVEHLEPSTLVLRIQPDDGINLQFGAKVPGPVMKVDMVEMNFCYQDYFGTQAAGGYETLLYDVMMGDHMLFTRADNVEFNWRIVEPILNLWATGPKDTLYTYPAGTWGPPEADRMIEADNRRWRTPDQVNCFAR